MLRQFAAPRPGEACFPLFLGQGSIDLAIVVWLVGAKPRREVRQLAEQYIQLDRAALYWHALDALAPSGIGVTAEHGQGTPRIGVRDHDGRGNPFASFEHYTLARNDL